MKLRKADEGDCRDLWIWRNHPEVRRWSFDAGEIEYESHRAWFERTLKRKDVALYIAEDKAGEKIGQVRFAMGEDKSARININLNPNFFGKGLGNKIIGIATAAFMKENTGVSQITAEVIKENAASTKAFQKAGYLFSRDICKGDRGAAIFKFVRTK